MFKWFSKENFDKIWNLDKKKLFQKKKTFFFVSNYQLMFSSYVGKHMIVCI